MSKTIGIVISFLVGSLIGLYVPRLADKIIEYKAKKCGYEIKNNYLPKYFRYAITAFVGVSFTLAFWFYPQVEATFISIFCLVAAIGTIVDYKMRIIANEMVLILLILGIIRSFTSDFAPTFKDTLWGIFIVVFVFGLTALLTHVFKKGFGVGAGDLKLAGVIALIVGYSGSIKLLFGMALTMCLYCVGGIYLRILTLKDTFPMCGFIMAGFVIALFYSKLEPIVTTILLS